MIPVDAERIGDTFTEADAARWHTLEADVPGGSPRVERLLLAARPLLTGTWILVRPPWSPALGPNALVKIQLPESGDVDAVRARMTDFLAGTGGGTVLDRPYKPVFERFGGEHGLAVSMTHFVAASRIALELIESAPERADRLDAVSALLLASARACASEVDGQVRWLRGYAQAQQGLSGESAEEIGRAARERAEADLARDGRASVLQLAEDAGEWREVQSDTWTALTRLHAEGRLSTPPEVVYVTLTHITHNRLGLLPQDNAYLAWLLALALTR